MTIDRVLAGFKILLLSGSVLMFGPGATAIVPSSRSGISDASDFEQIIAFEKASWVAWKMHDAKFFERSLSAEHVEMTDSGPTNRSTVIRGVTSGCVVKAYEVDQFHATRLNERTILLTYKASQDTQCGGSAVPSPVWATSIYSFDGNHWLNAVYVQTPAR